MKQVSLLVLASLALSPVFPAQTGSATGTVLLSVDQAVNEAREANPDIRAAVRRLTLAQMKVSTARSLDDPMLSVRDWSTPVTKPWDLNQAQIMFMVQQTFSNTEKRSMRAKLAQDNAEVVSEDLETLRQDVATEVRKTCAELMRNADAHKVHERQDALLKEALSAALAEYTTGKVSQADVLRAQMAVTRLNEHMIELEQERDSANAQLNALLGRRPDQEIEIEGTYAASILLPSTEQLEQTAIEHRPELTALRRQVATAQDEGRLSRMATKPDFTVGLGYMLMPSGSTSRNAYMAELSMNMPSWNRARHEGEAKQADAATDVTQAELQSRSNAVFLQVRQAEIEVKAAQKRVKLYQDTLLPQADAAFKSATAAYRNQRGDFANLIESQNVLLDAETALYTAQAAVDTGIARLERATGAPLVAPRKEESK